MTATTPSGGGRPPADCYADINGLRIHYLDWGGQDKQPLILLHGIARVAHTFDHLAPHFTANYHVIAVDMRGHGDSGWSAHGAYLVEDYTSDVAALIEQLKLRNLLATVGNSTGGRVAQMIAGTRPELTAAVISEDVGPERPPAISNNRANRMAKEADGWATVEDLMKEMRKNYPLTADPLLRNLIAQGAKQRTDGRLILKRDPAILKGFVPTELWASVSKIKAPIMYILGGASTIVPKQTQQQLKQTLPQVEIVEMADLGHFPSDERPEEFLAIVDKFLTAAKAGKQ